ncbi:unnamed protein product [Closterium sp. Naga37s-1]|nr:unnamed protein product [Closterium sp. Naga37s-1]
MARQAPQRGKPLLPLLALIVSATVAVAQDAIYPVTYVPATQSLRFGPGYIAFVNTATSPPSLTVVDSTGAPVAPISNADGSATVAGYTAYPNGTITGPGGLSIYIGAGDALVAMGTTTALKNGTIVDGSGMKLVPSKNADGSYTAGGMTGWSNGTIVGSGGAVINAGAPLTLTADGSIAFAPRLATPAPGAAISLDPASRSLSFGGYTVTVSLSGDKLSLVDSTGKPVATTPNPDGSRSLGDYMLYRNGTIAAPGGIAIHSAGPNAGLRVGTTTVLMNGTILDSTGAKIVPTGPNEDGSYSAGDVKGWANGTIIDTNTASPPTDASPPPAGSTSPPAGSTSPPAGASTPAAPPPPPKTAGLFASPATALTALITLALAPLMFM